MARQSAVRIVGLNRFRRDLRSRGAQWSKELRKVNKEVGEHAAEWARGGAQQHGGVTRKAAYSIVGAGTQAGARIRWGGTGYPFADGAFFGAKNYPQFAPWIGASWKVAEPGGGPYGINPALAARKDDIGELYVEALYKLLAAVDAFDAEGIDALA